MPDGTFSKRVLQKKRLLIPWAFFLFSLFFIGCAHHNAPQESNLSCIQITDRHGITETISSSEKLLRLASTDFTKPQPYHQVIQIFKKNSEGKTPGAIIIYYPNGQIAQYLETQDGRAMGKYRAWYNDGQLKIEATIIGGTADLSVESQKNWLFDGLSSAWDEKGNLIAKIPYEKGVLHGEALYYYKDLSLKKSVLYEKGVVEGKMVEYNKQQEIIQESYYHNDKKQGKSIRYWKAHHPQYIEEYIKGKLYQGKYFDISNRLIATIENGEGKKAIFKKKYLKKILSYHQGKLDGKVEVFTKQGELKRIYHKKNNHKQGEETLFYLRKELPEHIETMQPKLTLYWDQEAINGTVKTWYVNGQIESQKQITNNIKNGSSSGWYRNGKVMFIEEYQMGRLISGSYFSSTQSYPISTVSDGFGIATIYDGDGIFIRKVTYYHGKPEENSP